jgi:hypothetical protein
MSKGFVITLSVGLVAVLGAGFSWRYVENCNWNENCFWSSYEETEAETAEVLDETLDYYAEALKQGMDAANGAQTAETPEQWSAVANTWNEAVRLLNQVPSENTNYAAAQSKKEEYILNREAARSRQKTAENAWLPDDSFGVFEADAGLSTTPVGFRWLKKSDGEYSCQYGNACWGMELVAKDGCPNNLYVELSLLDSNDVNVGLTNETTSSVPPGGIARMVFETYEDGAAKARVAEISCY